jgi:four helix bundle protein
MEGQKMEEKHSFKKLNVWQKAYLLVLNTYKQTQKFPSFELYGLTSQIRRGAVSILANIAEGSERQYKKEFVQFLSIARGSLAEIETYLMLSRDLGYLNQDEFIQLGDLRKEVGRLLRGLYKSLS